MSKALTKAIIAAFKDICATPSRLEKFINLRKGAKGLRVFPPQSNRNDEKYGIRFYQSHELKDKPGHVLVNLQANLNAEDRTIRRKAREDSHNVLASVAVDTTREPSVEYAMEIRDQFLAQMKEKKLSLRWRDFGQRTPCADTL